MSSEEPIDLIVNGTSQGGFKALKTILSPLPANFPIPVLVMRHQAADADADDYVVRALNQACQLEVKFAQTGGQPRLGVAYLPPPGSSSTDEA